MSHFVDYQHAHVVQFLGFNHDVAYPTSGGDVPTVMIVMEFLRGGDQIDFVLTETFPEILARSYFKLLPGIEHCCCCCCC